MKIKLIGLLIAGAALVCAQRIDALREVEAEDDCVAHACTLTSNIAWDSSGYMDSRVGTWGSTDYVRTPYHFKAPAGYRVQILHARGDLIGAARGIVPDGAWAGILWGLLNSSSGPDPHVDLSANGCYIYHQGIVDQRRERIHFDEDTRDVGLLDTDNIMWSQIALYLNDTGQSIHQEASFLVAFRFVKDPNSGEQIQ